jgi:hypothetical protein
LCKYVEATLQTQSSGGGSCFLYPATHLCFVVRRARQGEQTEHFKDSPGNSLVFAYEQGKDIEVLRLQH